MRRTALGMTRSCSLRRAFYSVALILLVSASSAPAYAQLECYQWRSQDNGFDSGWRADNQSVVDAWKEAKNNGAQITACGPTSRLYEIGTITPIGQYPGYTYTVPAKLDPSGNQLNLSCNLTGARQCGALFYVNAEISPEADCGPSCNGVGKPISPASGNEFHQETDVVATGPNNPIGFSRFYNSGNTLGSKLGAGWRHSYSRSITSTLRFTPFRTYISTDPNNSSLYTTESAACTSGFSEIRARNSSWATAVATYSNNACTISVGGVYRGTLKIYFADQYPQSPGPAQVGYTVTRDNGQTIFFVLQGSTIVAPAGISLRLQVTGGGYQLTDDQDNVETYDTTGRLLSVTARSGVTQTASYDGAGRLASVIDSFGHGIALAYDGANRLTSVTTASGSVFNYGYDAANRLASVTNPDLTSRSYQYNDASLPTALTGIVDEATTQYASIGYDGATGKATSTQLAGGVNGQTLVYNSNGTVTVTDALGAVRTFTFSRQGDRNVVAGISGSQCPSCREPKATTYDSAGFASSRLDYRDYLTTYVNDPVRGLETSRTEGLTSSGGATPRTRTTTTSWHATFRVPLSISVYAGATATGTPLRTTSFSYDAAGNVLTRTVTDPATATSRTWTFTYDGFGRVLTADGPRTDVSDVTTYTYYTCTTGYQCGQVQTVTNPLNQTTTYNTYNAHGLPLTITDPNGVVTTLGYDARQRITGRQIGTETTTFEYWPTGRLKKVTLPDASYLLYTYDAAQRLKEIADAAGNKIVYTLDAMGNRTEEKTYDASSALTRTRYRVYNTLNQLWKEIGAANTAAVTTTFGYDANGNQTSINAPLARNTANAYDELNRLRQITDPANGVTAFTYDATDNLTQVTDPRNLVTGYQYNGLGDLTQLTSPDTGVTGYTFDSGGNLKTQTDARGKVGTYTYDALNRVQQLAYPDRTVTFTYDAGTNGKGRLTGASDANHSMSWAYDALGRVISKSQTVGTITRTVGYSYSNGRLQTLTTPSGQSVGYTYDAVGRISGITVNGTALLSSVLYDPFGPVRSWQWANGTYTNRTYDQDGKLSNYDSSGFVSYGYDDAFRITSRTDSAAGGQAWTFGYDALDRLTSGVRSGLNRGWTYDANGNRLTQTGTNTATYTVSSTSNRIASITGTPTRTYGYDAAGNTTSYGTITLTYQDDGRLKTSQNGSTVRTYVYNALGQRAAKKNGTSNTHFAYDEAGHLIGEYSNTGALVNETVWLGDIPVAVLTPKTGGVDLWYIHSDNLNTPKKITRPSDNALRWRWDPDPFGTNQPNQNPASLGTFTYNLRFPGQYYDSETGLSYNYFRDYDPQVGRYVESDPIGLFGGSWSTFSYAGGDPISNADPTGELAAAANPVVVGGIVVGGICAAIPSCRDAAVNLAKAIKSVCSSVPREQEEDKNCEALFQSTLRTCASLTGRKRFACFEAARENREQCYREKGKTAPGSPK